MWGHLRSGFDFLDTFTVPSTDTYSFTGDRTWINHEWLFDVAVALIYRSIGPIGFNIAAGLLALASIAVARHAARGAGLGGWRLDALTAGVFLLGIAPLLQTFRAQQVSALLFLLLLACIRAFDAGKRESRLAIAAALPVVGQRARGLGLGRDDPGDVGVDPIRGVAPRPCAAAANRGLHGRGGRHLRQPGRPASLGVPAGDGTPRALGHPRVALRRDERADAGRLVRDDGRLAAGAWRAPRGARVYLALAAFTAVSSFRVMRLLPFHAMTVFLLVAPWLLSSRRAEPKADREPPFTVRDWIVATVVWAIVVGGSVGSSRRAGCLQPAGAFSLDGRAGHFLRDNHAEGRLLVYFDWGEYVLWHLGPGLKVSIDGRRETVYSARTIARHQAFYKAAPGARAYLEELAPDLVWLPRKVAVSQVIGSWGWQPVFESPESVVWAPDGSARRWRTAQHLRAQPLFPGTVGG